MHSSQDLISLFNQSREKKSNSSRMNTDGDFLNPPTILERFFFFSPIVDESQLFVFLGQNVTVMIRCSLSEIRELVGANEKQRGLH